MCELRKVVLHVAKNFGMPKVRHLAYNGLGKHVMSYNQSQY